MTERSEAVGVLRDSNPAQSWRCVCGHPLYRHALRRRSSGSEQSWGSCHLCRCDHGRAETEEGEE